jgi:hypothetical protein
MLTVSLVLPLAAVFCVIAAALHFACLTWGAAGYRFLGAGEKAAAAVEAGDRRPHVSAVVVGSILLVWAAYAMAGAGVFPAMPLMRPVLLLISGVLLARALLFPLLRPLFPGNSMKFWLISSIAVGVLGLLFLVGALQVGQS